MERNLDEILSVLPAFAFEGALESVSELRSGHINNTYRLVMSGGRQYLLQRVNGYVFKNPEAVMRNIERVTAHLRAGLARDGLDPGRRVLTLIPVRAGGWYTVDAARNLWRAYDFIEGATAYNLASRPAQLYEAGRAFGEFQRRLSDFPAAELIETIPHFHDTPRRAAALKRALKAATAGRPGPADRVGPAGRAKTAAADAAFLLERARRAGEIVDRLSSGALPVRVTHNDTKINNVMLDDRTGEALCVIDLDTVMPGSALYDFGDAIRFGASTSVEDEPDPGRMKLDMEKYRLFASGFLREMGASLTPAERELLPTGAWMMTYELTMRFLTDYLDGDRYFKTDYPEHNLVRARAQAALLQDIEARVDEMRAALE